MGSILFIGAITIFYAFIGNEGSGSRAVILNEDASFVIRQVGSHDNPLGIVNENELNISKAGELKNMDYNELKAMLRAEGDFCIYLEDENGNVILINDTYKAIGSPNIDIAGIPCDES